MTTKNIVFTRFNTSFDPSEDRFQRCVGNVDWWEERYRMIDNYFIESLKNQTMFSFAGIVSFSEQIPGFMDKSNVKMLLTNWNFRTNYESENKTKYNDPYKALIELDFDCNFIRLICIDSDDLIIDDFVERINQIEPSRGQIIQSEGGYFYGVDSGKLVRQQADKASEVFCKDIPVDVLDSEQSYLNYLDEYNLDLYNNELHKADKVKTLDGYNFMQTIHGANDSSGWDNERSQARMESEVPGDWKTKTLERFGIDE